MEKLARYLAAAEAADEVRRLAADLGVTEFAQVRNLDYVFSPHELYPLAPRVQPPLERIVAFAVDMDGTSTTTEPLALHALEYMVRRITGRLHASQWAGLDDQQDHPYVIGNSNFRHTEFLVQRYRKHIDRAAFTAAFIEAVAWTLANMSDAQRRRDVQQNARNCGLVDLLGDADFRRLVAGPDRPEAGAPGPSDRHVTPDDVGRLVVPLVQKYGPAFRPAHLSAEVAAALDIYYLRYHFILRELERGQGERLARESLGDGGRRPRGADATATGRPRGADATATDRPLGTDATGGRRLVEPMPGYDVFVPLVKGWLGPEIAALYEPLRAHLLRHAEWGHTAAELDSCRPRLVKLAEHFRRNPAKLALVTASIAYETHACIQEVMHVLAEQVRQWPVPAACRETLAERLADYRAVFDGFVCASDAWEARLKPHRDLYALALFQMSIPKPDYPCVVGLEDTEPGIIALRAAGVGCAVALPNRDTHRQDYSAAVEVVRGGLPELILVRNLLLAEK